MKCEQMRKLFSPYLDKMTSPKETRMLEGHLANCSACRKQMEEMASVRTLLKNLNTPQTAPASFAEDLNNRLKGEKIKIFAEKELVMTPRSRSSSILAAGVAALALSVGVFASSHLPAGMMATIQDYLNKENVKSNVAVIDNDKILQEWMSKDSLVFPEPPDSEVISNGEKNSSIPNKGSNSSKMETGSLNMASTDSITVKEKVADKYYNQMRVEDIDQSLQKIVQIASANGGKYSIKSGDRTVSAAAAGNYRVVALQIPKENANKVLNELSSWGAGAAAKEPVNYTSAYAEAERTMAGLEDEINSLKSHPVLSPHQQMQLHKAENMRDDLVAEKQRIDKEVSTVTIEVRLLETFNP